MPKGNGGDAKRRAVIRAMMDAIPTSTPAEVMRLFDAAEAQAWQFIARAYLSANDDNCEGK